MDRLRHAWESVFRLGEHTIFQAFSWNQLAADHFRREAPFVSLFEDDNGMALVPAAVADGVRMTFLGEKLFDYRDVLAVGDTSALAEAWRPIAELGFPLSVTAVRGRSADRWNFAGLAPFCSAPAVRRSEASAKSMEAHHRKLGRFSRRLRKDVELKIHDGSSSELLRWIYQQKARQFRGDVDNIFSDTRRAEFIVAVGALQPASCEIFTYERGSRIVAALVTFRDGDVRRFYTVWFDIAWAKESPGQVLVYEATLETLRNGLDCDYMTGEQLHKTRLATSSEPLHRVEMSSVELRSALDRMSQPALQAA